VTEGTFFLDVSIPMYAAGRAHAYKDNCTRIMTDVAEGRLAAVIDTEIIQEILYRYGALGAWDTAVMLATNLLDLVDTTLPVRLVDAQLAIDLFRRYGPQGVRARDVLHVAVMQNCGMKRIISSDGHFDLIEGIERIDPHDFVSQRGRE
jgi:predicted nucleic acid-binding protein